ncbi:MAG: N-acetylmuramoyl-L-alanine amidase [Paludibacteraceae bacterium]|nr:N-acetylmuramoyl-L-alanine amidase [Paludibacteraceae bacterium]
MTTMQKHLLLTFALLCCMLTAHAFTVVLDAGHGGNDAGAVGAFSKEKNINLKYTLELGDLIKKNHPDVKVIYTRNKDVFVNLNERARIANRAKADLFISIHTNASKNKSANGMETFTLGVSRSKENMEVAMLENSVILLEDDYEKKYEGFDPNSTDSYIMFEFMKDQYMDRSISCADLIQQNMINASKRNNRGVRQAGFLVLRATTMPSILIELGFISNKEEEKFLNNSDNQTKICKAIYQAFTDYKHNIDKKNGKDSESGSGASTSSATENSQESKVESQKSEVESQKSKVESQSKPSAETNSFGYAEAQPDFMSEANKSQKSKVDESLNRKTNESTKQLNDSTIEYYWQILVSKNNYNLTNKVFHGLIIGNVKHENNVYKYLVGPASSKEEIEKQRNNIKQYFPDAFIVTYQDGKRVYLD